MYKNFAQSNGNSYILSRSWKSGDPTFSTVISSRDQQGSFLWSRIFVANDDSSLLLSDILKLTDGSIMALGTIRSSFPYRESQKPLLVHIDDAGNLLSCWRIDLKETSHINGFFRLFLCQTDASSIGLLINYSTEDVTSAVIIIKLDIVSSSCVWSNKFYKNSFFYAGGMIVDGNELTIACNFSNRTGSLQKNGFNLIKLSSLTGEVNLSRSYENVFENSLPTLDYFTSLRLLGNGSLKLMYSVSKDNEPNRIVSVNLDKTAMISATKCVANIVDNYLIRNYSVNSSGSFAFSFFNSSDPNDQGYIVVDSNYRLVQQRKLAPSFGTDFSVAFPNNDLYLSDDNRLTVFTGVRRNFGIEMESVSTNIYNRDTGCIGSNFNEAIIEDFSLQPSIWTLNQKNNPLPELSSYSVCSNSLFIQKEQVCLSIKDYNPSLPDKLTKCNNDSVMLNASPDFVRYNWQPEISQVQINDSTINVFPSITTDYSVTAHTYWGCEMKDTVKIIAAMSPKINLGSDTSMCEGSIIDIDAGKGFVNYLWNDGSTNSFKQIKTAGTYFVNAVDSNGCASSDTIDLLHIYPKPSINIHQKRILCREQSDILKPGVFTWYLWQDGSSSSNFKVESAGKYWVKVMNDNGCSNSDTVVISNVVQPPSHFIIQDTVVCQYETIQLKPVKSFSSYLWSTSSSTSSISVNSPGSYWLEVIDNNGCKAKEYINVSAESCPMQIFFPSAFTPNGDGKNDLFKPAVKGLLEQYEFSIFNRWGQKIFSTNDFLNGWNGKTGNIIQDGGTFIWMCRYQFKDQKPKMETGSFILIR